MRPHLQRIDRPAGASFNAFERRSRQFDFDWHHHPEVELTLIARGRGRRYVGDAVEDYSKGDCVLLGSYLPHTWASYGRGMQSALVVQFGGERIKSLSAGAPELTRIAGLLDRSDRGIRFNRIARPGLEESLRKLVESSGVDRLAMLLKVLDLLARSHGGQALASPAFVAARPVVDHRLGAVHAHINKHVERHITQQELADIAGLTPAAFCRFFKRSTGRTFVAHLHELRVGRACQILLESQRSVTDACFAAGFGNVSNFNRIFLRLKGVSPREYRAQFNQAEARS